MGWLRRLFSRERLEADLTKSCASTSNLRSPTRFVPAYQKAKPVGSRKSSLEGSNRSRKIAASGAEPYGLSRYCRMFAMHFANYGNHRVLRLRRC